MIEKLFEGAEKGISKVCKALSVCGAVVLVAMMLMINTDVFGRFLFNKPFVGAYEIVEFLMIVVIFLAIPFGQVKKQHVNVELFAQMLHGKGRALLDSLTYLISFVMFLLVTYASVRQAINIWKVKQSSLVLLIPQWPVVAIMAIGVCLFTLSLFSDFFGSLLKLFKK